MEDDYTFVQINHVDNDNNGSTIDLLGNLDARTSPHGEADFLISAYVSSDTFNLKAAYPVPSFHKRHVSPEDFVKSHMTTDVQEKINIRLQRKCSNKQCEYSYFLSTAPIVFDMKTYKVSPLELQEETFRMNYHDNTYYFRTNFATEQTTITYHVPKAGFVIGAHENIQMKSEKFLKYPLEAEFLLNKLKTLLLFS